MTLNVRTFNRVSKVSDDETLKKYSKQNDDFSDDQAKSIFDNNDDYQTRDRYYRQDVIRNPWFWMYMSDVLIIAMGIHTVQK